MEGWITNALGERSGGREEDAGGGDREGQKKEKSSHFPSLFIPPPPSPHPQPGSEFRGTTENAGESRG